MAAPEFESHFRRKINMGQRPYVDITGTTNGTLNTQTLFTHTLTTSHGAPLAPTYVEVHANGLPAGIPYEVSANHTSTQVDIRATGASVAFRARIWA